MKRLYTTTLRLNLENEADREALEHLRRMDRKKYRSVNSAVITAINAYFSRQEQLEADPYLETREKEDAFLQRVIDTIRSAQQPNQASGLAALLQLLQGTQGAPSAPTKEEVEANNSTDWDAALDFVGSF